MERCLWCHEDFEEGRVLCPRCGSELSPGAGTHISAATHAFRPAGRAAFTGGGPVVLCRLSVEGSLVYRGHEGAIEANVVEERTPTGRARLACVDLDGDHLFHLETHDAATSAFAAFFPPKGVPGGRDPREQGDHLATFLKVGTALAPEVVVRDEASAPVATLRPHAGGLERFDLVETGGRDLACCSRDEYELGDHLDDRWVMTPFGERAATLHRLALVAVPLVCLILFGRPPRRRVEHASGWRWSGDDDHRDLTGLTALADELFG